MNRNSKKAVKQDVNFLEEMLFNLEQANTDLLSYDHLKTMINDWKSELDEILLKTK